MQADLDTISLASLEPSVSPKSEITATVASLWPYSSSALKLTAIIVELDYRKRENRGELKVSFGGYAAESLKTLAIGDIVKISLEGAAWEALSEPEERDVPWQLKWEKRLRVKVFKDETAAQPIIDIDKTFDQANKSGIFERIAAAEAIINESQFEQDEDSDVEVQTPPKPSQLPGSWSTSFRDSTTGGSQTPINIFAQGRRRLFSLGSDDEEDDIDADRTRKKPRLFEPHQSFRYVSDSPGDRGEEEGEPQITNRIEDNFFDENSFRESFRAGDSAPRLYVRPDDAGDVSVDNQTQRTTLGDKPRGPKLYVRPDDSQAESDAGSSIQPMSTQVTEDQGSRRKTVEMDDEIFQIIFGQQPEPLGVKLQTGENETFSRSLTESTSQDSFSARTPLASQDTFMHQTAPGLPQQRSTTPPFPIGRSTTPPFPPTKSTTPPFPGEKSFTPPFPETLRPVDMDSQPMSSFTLDASQATRPMARGMFPPSTQSQRVPRLDTQFLERFDPVTPVLKPTASPALPLPSPFPSSALEKGTTSFFPSRLSQSFTSSTSEDTQVKVEDEQSEPPAAVLATTKAAVEQLEKLTQMKQEADSQDEVAASIQMTGNPESVERAVETSLETITVVEHASSLVDPASSLQTSVTKQGDTEIETRQSVIETSRHEVIEILDSSDDAAEDDDEEYEEEEEYEEYEEEHGEPENKRRTSQERYEEELAEENDEEEYIVEEDEYPQTGELAEVLADDGDDYYPQYEELEALADGGDDYYPQDKKLEDEREREYLEYDYRTPTISPDIEERESPFVSDDDEPPRAPKVGASLISTRGPISYISPLHSSTGPEVASPPSARKQDALVAPGPSALRGSVFSYPQNFTSSKSLSPPASDIPHNTTKMTAELLISPAPYFPQSTSPSPPQPRTPKQSKQLDFRTPNLEDNGFEFAEDPQVYNVSPSIDDKDDDASSHLRKKRLLPWLTPQVLPEPKHPDDMLIPNSVPDKLRTPAADTLIAIQEMIEAAQRLRGKDSATKPILKPKLDINPDAIRRFREYNKTSGVVGGVITSLSEFVPVRKLLNLEWDKTVDLLAVSLREGEVVRNKTPPGFFQLKVWVIDPSCANGKPVPIVLTRPYEAALPKTTKPGDVLLLRNIRIKSQDNQRCGFSTMSSGWRLWRPRRALDGQQEMVVIPHDGPNAEFGAEEVAYVNSLWEWWKGIDMDIRVYLINKKERAPRKSEVRSG